MRVAVVAFVTLILTAASSVNSVTAQVKYQTAQDMLYACQPATSGADIDKMLDEAHCLGWVAGVHGTMQRFWVLAGDKDIEEVRSHCRSITNARLAQIFINFMRDHPEVWRMTATGVAMEAFEPFYRCDPVTSR